MHSMQHEPQNELLQQYLRQQSLLLEALTRTNQELVAARDRARLAEQMEQRGFGATQRRQVFVDAPRAAFSFAT